LELKSCEVSVIKETTEFELKKEKIITPTFSSEDRED